MRFRCSVTKMQLISQGCAVAEHTYYCEVTRERADIKSGLYTFSGPSSSFLRYNRLVTLSDKVWLQGPRGGVKIIKDRAGIRIQHYVTNDVEEMKEFMWAKLQAQTVN